MAARSYGMTIGYVEKLRGCYVIALLCVRCAQGTRQYAETIVCLTLLDYQSVLLTMCGHTLRVYVASMLRCVVIGVGCDSPKWHTHATVCCVVWIAL